MRLVSFLGPKGPRIAGVRGEEYVDLHDADSSIPPTMNEFLAGGDALSAAAGAAIQRGRGVRRETCGCWRRYRRRKRSSASV